MTTHNLLPSAIRAGAAFPASPTTGAKFYRTDRKIEYVYDGARWLSGLHTELIALPSSSITATTLYNLPFPGRAFSADIWIENFTAMFYQTVATTNTSTNYFTAKLQRIVGAGTVNDIGVGVSSAGMTLNNRTTIAETIGTLVTNASLDALMVRFDKVGGGSATIMTPSVAFSYRLVG